MTNETSTASYGSLHPAPGAPGVPGGCAHRHLAGMSLLEVSLPAGTSVAAHGHADAHCCLVLRGSLIERDGRRRHRLDVGQLRHSPPDDRHHFVAGTEGVDCFVIVAPPNHAVHADRRVYDAGSRRADLASRMHQHFRANAPYTDVAVHGLMLELFAQGRRLTQPRAPMTAPGWLLAARRHVERTYEEAPALADVARVVGVHRVQLARAFRAHFGCTVGELTRSLQINAARHLVLATSRSLAEIAAATGHADQSHLTRRFRKAFGVTPARMRRSHADHVD